MIFLSFVFIFGTILGSFLNCLVHRLHEKEGIMDRSYCPACRAKISWYDNIPILSFIFLKGYCRHCHKKISWQYPLVEFFTGILFVLVLMSQVGFHYGINADFLGFIFDKDFIINSLLVLQILRDWFIVCVMIIVFVYDWRWYLVHDLVVFSSILVIFIFNLLLGATWYVNILFSLLASSFFFIQYQLAGGKWIGGGDIRLGLLIGIIFFSWQSIFLAIFLSYLIGAVVAVGLIIAGKKKWGSKLPLGVFLALGSVICLIWGHELLFWYINLIT